MSVHDDHVLQALRKAGVPRTTRRLADELDTYKHRSHHWDVDEVRRSLKRLEKQGTVERRHDESGRPNHWQATPEPTVYQGPDPRHAKPAPTIYQGDANPPAP